MCAQSDNTVQGPPKFTGVVRGERVKITPKVANENDKFWVGLIVRGKLSAEHKPGLLNQHADVVFPSKDGTEMQTLGYFGQGEGNSSSKSLVPIGIGMQGYVADFQIFLHDPFRSSYVVFDLAKRFRVPSTVILIKVTSDQVQKLNDYWKALKENADDFYILGHNCSTMAAGGLKKAGITKDIRGLDTPDNLFKQLRREYKDAHILSGQYGYIHDGEQCIWKIYEKQHAAELVSEGKGSWIGPFVERI
jgi:hypothetical protein